MPNLKCPICGWPAELVFVYHCTNSTCQNYDEGLVHCPTAGQREFDDTEITEKISEDFVLEMTFPLEEEWDITK